jgi:hypothetical protein
MGSYEDEIKTAWLHIHLWIALDFLQQKILAFAIR